MPASSAWSTGSLKASLSTTATARPSALPEIAVLVAFTISATFDSFEPVNWNSQLSSAQASWAPYWVGVKNGLVVTWLTNTNFHLGVEGKSPEPAAAALPPDGSSEPQAASSAAAASEALVRPAPFSSRRRVIGLSPSVSTACSTVGSTLDMGTSSCGFPTLSVVGGEPVDGGRVVLLARPQHGRREVVMVGRVRVVLGLQRQAVALPVHPAAGADQGAVQEVARVELDARLVGEDLQDPAASRVGQPRRQLQPGAAPVQHPVVVVAAADDELRVAVADARTDRGRPGEVQRRAGHRGDLAGGDQGRVDRGVVAGPQQQLVVVDVAGALTGEVPVGVVGEGDDGRRVGGRLVAHAQRVAVVQRVGDGGVEGARIVLLAIGADAVEPDADAVVVADHFRVPHPLVEADVAAVQVVGRVVDGELVGDAVEGEPAVGDAVGVAAGDAAEVRVARVDVALQCAEPEGDVGPAAAAVGHLERLDGAAVG